jgi:hypothetical protein
LGLDEGSFNILLGGIAIAVLLLCTIILGVLTARAIRWRSGRRKKEAEGVVILEEDVVDVIDEDDIAVEEVDTSSIVEVVDDSENTNISRRSRREKRAIEAQIADNLPLPMDAEMPPIPTLENGIPMPEIAGLPPLNRPVICPDCSSRFEVSTELTVTRCPICALRINL